jgi:hypothetical protein
MRGEAYSSGEDGGKIYYIFFIFGVAAPGYGKRAGTLDLYKGTSKNSSEAPKFLVKFPMGTTRNIVNSSPRIIRVGKDERICTY